MGTWHSLRVAFILGSLFMLLLIIAYWDDIGGFNLYPFQDLKHDSLHSDCGSQRLSSDAALSASTIGARSGPSVSLPITSRIPLSPEDTAQTHPEEEQKKPPWENARKERSRVLAGDGDQDVRKQMIADVCSGKNNVEFPGRTRVIEQIPYRELDHLIVDDTHQIIYCYVPKVACTNWKKVLVVLSQALISPSSGKPYIDPEAVPAELVHNSSLHLTFAKFWHHYGSLSRYLMALKLQRYTKFLFVRDPFVRLISAFRNKFGRPNEDFYKQFGSVMLRRFGNVSGSLPETAAEAFAAGIKPTFKQFIAYLLDPETEKDGIFNEHWRQVYRLCHPCQVKYDFIGHLETLEEDTERLLKILKVDHLLHFPSGAHNLTSTSWERDWFAQIPIATRKELYKLYEPDFEMFGYAKPDGLLQQELD